MTPSYGPSFTTRSPAGWTGTSQTHILSHNPDCAYILEILMHHRIHEKSETTAIICDDTRSQEDLDMFCHFRPKPIAVLINSIFGMSLRSNSLFCGSRVHRESKNDRSAVMAVCYREAASRFLRTSVLSYWLLCSSCLIGLSTWTAPWKLVLSFLSIILNAISKSA